MADESVVGALVNDLLSRVQKLEGQNTKHEHEDIQQYLATLDRVAFSMTIAIDVMSKVLVDKGLITKEELNKALEAERDRVTKELQARLTGEAKPEL